MNLKNVFLVFLFFPIVIFGQLDKLLDKYEIPTYSFHTMNLYGQDFLNYLKVNYLENNSYGSTTKTEDFDASLGFMENVVYQTPDVTRKTYGIISAEYSSNSVMSQGYNYSTHNYEEVKKTTESSSAVLGISAFNNWYVLGNRGLFIFCDPGLLYSYNFQDAISSKLIDIPFGVGYGRVIGVRSVVQSYIISDELQAQLSDDDMLKLSEVIEKYDGGYYDAEFKDDAKIEFYKDISNITKKPEQTEKINQILNSSIYKTSERYMGWQVKLGANISYLDKTAWTEKDIFGQSTTYYSTATDLLASAEYGLPIGFDKQLYAEVDYSKNLNDETGRMPKLNLLAKFSIDHNYKWASSVYAGYSVAFPKKENNNDETDNLVNKVVGVRSDMVIINSFSAYAYLEYTKNKFDETTFVKWAPITNEIKEKETIEFHLGFNYYIK